MAKTFSAQLDSAIKLSKKNIRYVATSAIQDVMEAAQTPQDGIGRGATSFVEGKIPVVSSDLINSLTSEGAKGADSYVAVIAGMKIGDYLRFAWTAPYARRIEMGFTGTDSLGRTYNVPGRHFVGKNAAKFQEFVSKRVREVSK